MNLLRKRLFVKYKNRKINYFFEDNNLIIQNDTSDIGYLVIPKFYKTLCENIKIKFDGEVISGNSVVFCLMDLKKNILANCTINSSFSTTINSKKTIAAIKVLPFSKVKIKKLNLEFSNDSENFFDNLNNEILIITPNYPTLENKYMCAFVHSRLTEYKKNGIKFDVICCHEYVGTTYYNFEGINVIRTNYEKTRAFLRRKKYKKILVHFFDYKYANVLDSLDLQDTELLLWVHGPETLYWDWPKFTTPYFTNEIPISEHLKEQFLKNDALIKRYNNMENVKWIFVSNWIKEHSEKLIGIKFNNYEVIPNTINSDIFKYNKKDAKLRKKIFFVRRFDDCSKYAIDIGIRTILELSKKEFFNDLEFNIYGIGEVYEKLVAPIKNFPNVHLFPKFLSHDEIAAVHKENGIALFPTRYDAQGVSLCEAAQSGLVIVTSDNPAIREFLNGNIDIFAETENYKEYAEIIEKIYKNPDLFEEYSEKCHELINEKCNFNETILKEINLIKSEFKNPKKTRKINKFEQPVLSVLIPSYNVENYLASCVSTLLNIKNYHEIELIIVNDGSTDKTLDIAKQLQEKYNYSVDRPIKIIDKPNGGHGSTINVGIKEAQGKFFRIVDSDDWVNSEDFEKLITILKDDDSDIVITDYCEDLATINVLNKKEIYRFMTPGLQYQFDDLCYENYGFNEWGPILATGNYKTEMLKKLNFKITEKSAYVDMEFNCYSIMNAQTITYYPLDIYRYFIGRSEQSVSLNSFKRKYLQHENILMNLIKIYYNSNELTAQKKKYLLDKLILPMVKSHYIILCEYFKNGKKFRKFDNKLRKFPIIYNNPQIVGKFILLSRYTKGFLLKFTTFIHTIYKILRRGR